MTDASSGAGGAEREIQDLIPVLRRVIGARVSDPSAVEDLVQETLARLLAVRARLDASSIAPYAIVTAQNLVRSQARAAERSARNAPRLLDPRQPDNPEELALAAEDRRAVQAALNELSQRDRESLVAHDGHGVPSADLPNHDGASARAVDVRLTRARARLRVEYVVALRRAELPTKVCRPVLLALSSGDKRQQRALHAGEHLLSCPTCAEFSQPIIQRRRPLAGVWPALGVGRLVDWIRERTRQRPLQSGIGAAVAVAGLTALVLISQRGPSGPSLYVVQGQPIALSGDQPLAPYAGQEVRADSALVHSVPIPEGFWVGGSAESRIWVDIESGDPVPQPLTAGQRVSFVGTLVPTPSNAGVLADLETRAPDDRALLERQGFHVEIAADALTVEGVPRR